MPRESTSFGIGPDRGTNLFSADHIKNNINFWKLKFKGFYDPRHKSRTSFGHTRGKAGVAVIKGNADGEKFVKVLESKNSVYQQIYMFLYNHHLSPSQVRICTIWPRTSLKDLKLCLYKTFLFKTINDEYFKLLDQIRSNTHLTISEKLWVSIPDLYSEYSHRSGVYLLRYKQTKQIRYIGKSVHTLSKRAKAHFHKKTHNHHVYYPDCNLLEWCFIEIATATFTDGEYIVKNEILLKSECLKFELTLIKALHPVDNKYHSEENNIVLIDTENALPGEPDDVAPF